jgi:predicted SAM-dependent methyltransferase
MLEAFVIHQRYKDLSFLVLQKATLPNFWLRRYMNSRKMSPDEELKLHVGCGPKYIEGFINIDANPFVKTDLWLDIRSGIPFPDGSVSSVYSTHMLEHFFPDELYSLLKDCYRVLKPGGGVRFIVPSLRNAISAYQQKRLDWFDSFPRDFKSAGGRFSNFIFCDGQHRFGIDFDYLDEMLRKVGFQEVEEASEERSRLFGGNVLPFQPGDSKDLPHSLYVEAFR